MLTVGKRGLAVLNPRVVDTHSPYEGAILKARHRGRAYRARHEHRMHLARPGWPLARRAGPNPPARAGWLVRAAHLRLRRLWQD